MQENKDLHGICTVHHTNQEQHMKVLKISTYYHINGKFTGKYVHSIPAKMTSVYTHHFVSEDGEPRSFTEKEIDSIVENNI